MEALKSIRPKPADDLYEVGPLLFHEEQLRPLTNVYKFEESPIIHLISGAAHVLDTGVDEEFSLHAYPDGLRLVKWNIGTQTTDKPAPHALGMDYAFELTAADGVEWALSEPTAKGREGITHFTVGKAAFYAKLKFNIVDVTGADECAFGFCLVDDFEDAIDDKNDMAAFNIQLGVINIETIVNGGSTTTTDTTETDWGDGETHTLEVYVSKAGVASFKYDGVAPTVSPTTDFEFDSGDVLTPFFHLLHATTSPGAVIMEEFEYGYQ